MNPTDDNLPPADDVQFDLLADGELPESDRRRLLESLDDRPGGWRRCALALLEAQSLRDGLAWTRQQAVAEAPRPKRPPHTRASGRNRLWGGLPGTIAAMAASFLLALGLGLVFRDLWRATPSAGPAPGEIAAATPAERPAPKPARKDDDRPPSTAPSRPGDDWQLVSLPVSGGTESIRVPARARDHVDEESLRGFAPTIPRELIEALQRGGHELHWSRRLLPFRMEDGKQLVVPCEEVEVRYVGNPTYH